MIAPGDITPEHCTSVLRAMLKGRVTPLLGAGANLSGRSEDVEWAPGSPHLPSSGELARYLARFFNYPQNGAAAANDLARVCQYVAIDAGDGPLYGELRDIFTASAAPPTPLHMFFARLARLLRTGKPKPPRDRQPPRNQLLLTTNYDDALERAFEDAGEPFDLVWYIADGRERGKFWHRPADAAPRLISDPNLYKGLSLEDRTVILKLHGTVDRADDELDSFVITEDHYIDYLTRSDVAHLVPAQLSERMASTHLLLLGHSMRDWNLRVILYRLWGDQRLSFRPWSVQLGVSALERRFWAQRGNVDIVDANLGAYVAALEARLPDLAEEILGD